MWCVARVICLVQLIYTKLDEASEIARYSIVHIVLFVTGFVPKKYNSTLSFRHILC